MYLLLDGPDRRELRSVLESAFDRNKLTMALAESTPSRDYASLVTTSNFVSELFELIGVAEREGWLDQLIGFVHQHTERDDLRRRAQAVLERAEQREKQYGGGQGAIAKLHLRFMLLAIAFLALGALALALGIMAYLLAPRIGIWSIPATILALAVMAAAAVLYRRSDVESTDLALSPVPSVFVAIMAVAALINGVLFYKGNVDEEPNFILTLIEKALPVVNQKVGLRSAVGDERTERTTNNNGEAFFTLLFSSNRIYWTEFKRAGNGQDCQTPAFVAEVQVKKIEYDLDLLKCGSTATGPSRDDDSLRTDDSSRTPPIPISGLTLPVDLAARLTRAPLGHPSAPLILDRRYYSLGFDPRLRSAVWVSFIVNENKQISVPRRRDVFVPDPALPPEIQASNEDFKRNPYDRGTLVRRSDASYGVTNPEDAELAQREVFYLSVVVPQPDKTNQVTWLGVETLTGELSRQHGDIHVFAGPIYKSLADANDSYLVVGPGKTLVPLFLYRVLLRKAADQKWRAIGFVVPNDGSIEKDPTVFLTSVADIETRTGLRFFPDLAPAGQGIKNNSLLKVFTE